MPEQEVISQEELPDPVATILSKIDAETILEYLNKKMPDTLVEFVVDEHRDRLLDDIGRVAVIEYFGIVVDPAFDKGEELEAKLEKEGVIDA